MGKVSFLKKKKLYFSPLEIKILKNILEMFLKKKKKKIIINTGFFSFLIYDYITCQHAACIYACRHSPKSDPPSLLLSLSLSHFSQLLWARIYHGKQSIRGDGDEQADCTSLRRIRVTIDFRSLDLYR